MAAKTCVTITAVAAATSSIARDAPPAAAEFLPVCMHSSICACACVRLTYVCMYACMHACDARFLYISVCDVYVRDIFVHARLCVCVMHVFCMLVMPAASEQVQCSPQAAALPLPSTGLLASACAQISAAPGLPLTSEHSVQLNCERSAACPLAWSGGLVGREPQSAQAPYEYQMSAPVQLFVGGAIPCFAATSSVHLSRST